MINNETLNVIKNRRSIRNFKEQQISDEELAAIIEAGKYAPYAGENEKHITVIQNRDVLEKINKMAKEGSKYIGMPHLAELGSDEEFNCIYNAPTLIIVSGKEKGLSVETDAAAATQNMLIAAESIGVGSCWIFFALISFYSLEGMELKKRLQIPEDYKPFTSIAIGYKNITPTHVIERNMKISDIK